MKKSTKGGFTLIELLVVISIIAILAAVGLTIYSTAQKNGRDAKRIGDLQEVQKALEQYYAANNQYPTKAQYSATSGSGNLGSYFQNGSVPTDPANTGNYQYVYTPCPVTGPPFTSYNVCVALESCGSKCTNTYNLNDCGSVGQPYSTNTFFCIAHLSN